jgi:hypothetical protein
MVASRQRPANNYSVSIAKFGFDSAAVPKWTGRAESVENWTFPRGSHKIVVLRRLPLAEPVTGGGIGQFTPGESFFGVT